jgi:hypothetical protein
MGPIHPPFQRILGALSPVLNHYIYLFEVYLMRSVAVSRWLPTAAAQVQTRV